MMSVKARLRQLTLIDRKSLKPVDQYSVYPLLPLQRWERIGALRFAARSVRRYKWRHRSPDRFFSATLLFDAGYADREPSDCPPAAGQWHSSCLRHFNRSSLCPSEGGFHSGLVSDSDFPLVVPREGELDGRQGNAGQIS